MAPRYYTVTWDQLHRDAKALAWRLVERGPWKGMVAINWMSWIHSGRSVGLPLPIRNCSVTTLNKVWRC